MDTSFHLDHAQHAIPAGVVHADKPKIDIQDLCFFYGTHKSLKNISLPLMEKKVTAFGNNFMSTDLTQPMASLPVVIFQYALSPYQDWHDLAWAGALLVTATVLILSIIARILEKKRA